MRALDFIEYSGHEASILLSTPLRGRRKFTGVVIGYEDGAVLIKCSDGEHRVPIEYIRRSRIKYEIEIGKKRK